MNNNKIQEISVLSNYKYNSEICKRAKLDIGTFCNYKCYFCYYKHSLNDKTSYDEVIERFNKLYELGCRDFDISGGEPSIFSKLEDLISHIKSLNCNVSMLSNGSNLSFERLEKLKSLGLNEILFSLHSTEELHNKMVGFNGFKKIVKAIKDAKSLSYLVRINSVITPLNYKEVDKEYLNLIKELNPSQVNFLPLNYFGDSKDLEPIEYNELLNPIKKFINSISDIEINVRYVPFCFMEGYEKHVKNYLQHIFDLKDWSLCYYRYWENTFDNMLKVVKDQRINVYTKDENCLKCKYFAICDGIEKQNYLNNKLTSIKGELIREI